MSSLDCADGSQELGFAQEKLSLRSSWLHCRLLGICVQSVEMCCQSSGDELSVGELPASPLIGEG